MDELTSAETSTSTIIYLNGASSSGKTSIARALQQTLDEPYYHLSTDTFAGMVVRRNEPGEAWDGDIIGPKFNAGFTHCVAAMAGTGNNVIVDDVLCESYRLDGRIDAQSSFDLLKQRVSVLAPFDVLYVGVHCALSELERRERARGDRYPGLARFQYRRVHAHSIYDVEVATTRQTVAECASVIRHALAHRRYPTTFEKMRELL